jgi:hypothetical protein
LRDWRNLVTAGGFIAFSPPMHAVVRAVPLALGFFHAFSILIAQPAELPAIFAPRVATPSPEPLVPKVRPARAPVSERARSLMEAAAVRVLEEAVAFDVPVTTGGTYVDGSTGATVMAPVVVKGVTLTDSQVRPPDLRLLHFERAQGDKHRRIAGGVTAPLYQTFFGQKELLIDFSILNGAGNGLDHQIDFVRAEIAFRFKW